MRGEKSHKVSLYTLCCVCREKDSFKHMKKGHRKKDTTGIPVIHLPTGSDKDAPWEKYYVFQYDPTLKLQVMKAETLLAITKGKFIMPAAKHLYESQGEDTFEHLRNARCRESKLDDLPTDLPDWWERKEKITGIPRPAPPTAADSSVANRRRRREDTDEEGGGDSDDGDDPPPGPGGSGTAAAVLAGSPATRSSSDATSQPLGAVLLRRSGSDGSLKPPVAKARTPKKKDVVEVVEDGTAPVPEPSTPWMTRPRCQA